MSSFFIETATHHKEPWDNIPHEFHTMEEAEAAAKELRERTFVKTRIVEQLELYTEIIQDELAIGLRLLILGRRCSRLYVDLTKEGYRLQYSFRVDERGKV